MKINLYILGFLLIWCWSCETDSQTSPSVTYNIQSGSQGIDSALYLKFTMDEKFLQICQQYDSLSLPLTRSGSELTKSMEEYAEANQCENIEDYIIQYNLQSSGDNYASLLGEWNSCIPNLPQREWQLLRLYDNTDIEMSEESLLDKIYKYISTKNSHIAALYKDFRIRNHNLTPFRDASALVSYFKSLRLPENLYYNVVGVISFAYTEMRHIIERELAQKPAEPEPERPTDPDAKPSEGQRMNVQEILKNALLYIAPPESMYHVQPSFFTAAAAANFGKWAKTTGSSAFSYLYFSIYQNFSCSESERTRTENFQIFRKCNVFDNRYSILEVRVNDGKSYTWYLLIISNTSYSIEACIEVGVWFRKDEQTVYCLKDWDIKKNNGYNGYTLTVYQLVTDSSLSGDSSFSSIQAQRVHTIYNIDNAGYLRQKDEQTYQPRTYSETNLRKRTLVVDPDEVAL